MTSTKELGCETMKLDFKNLSSILRKSLADISIEVTDFSAKNFMPLGENFGSVMIKLDVTVTRKADGSNKKTENLHLVAKTVNPSERPILSWPVTARKEVFIFSKLLPAYRNLEREMGYQENQLIDLLPKYYGHRKSLIDSSPEFDDDSFFLMENMKLLGYYNGNKKIGLDIEHTRKTILALARYHALGTVLKKKKPELFKEALRQSESLGVDVKQLDEGFLGVLENFRACQTLFKNHLAAIELSFEANLKGKRFTVLSKEPWVTITHGDMWVNNILFHKDDQTGQVDDVKFVDFQIFLCNSPLKDLMHFLGGSVEDNTLINHFDDLVNDYYNKFTNTLELLGYSSKHDYTRAAFDKELKKQAFLEFPICAMCRKYFAFEMKDEKTSSELLGNFFDGKCTDAIIKRYQVLVNMYERKGWFYN